MARPVCDELIEQLVLRSLELDDLGLEIGAVAAHGLRVLAGLAQLPLCDRSLGDKRSDARVLGLVGEVRELLVDDA